MPDAPRPAPSAGAASSGRVLRPRVAHVRPFLVGLACFAVLAAVDQARGFVLWRNYALSGVVLGGITTWILWRKDVRVPLYIQWVIVAGLLLHYGGGSLGSPDPYRMGLLGMHGVNGAYHEFTWWDNLTHGVGIGAGAMGIAYLAQAYQLRRGLGWGSMAIASLALLGSLTAGVAVELYEYLGKAVFQTIDQGGYVNTMRDLHFNVLGAAVGTVVAVTVDRRRLHGSMVRHWGAPAPRQPGRSWRSRWPPGALGFVAFTAPPTAMTLLLSVRFLIQGPLPGGPTAGYDAALQAMLWSALAGLVAGPLVTLATRRSRAAPEKSP